MKKFCKDLRKQVTKIINFEEKEMLPPIKNGKKKHKNIHVKYVKKNSMECLMNLKINVGFVIIVITRQIQRCDAWRL